MQAPTIQVLFALAGALILSGPATAGSLTWTLENVAYGSGATVSGSFTIDQSTNLITGVNITSTADGSFAGATYLFQDIGFGYPGSTLVGFSTTTGIDPTGQPTLVLIFPTSLDTAGTNALFAVIEGRCSVVSGTNCTGFGNDRVVAAGDATTSPATPEPASASFVLCAGLGALLASKFRRRVIG